MTEFFTASQLAQIVGRSVDTIHEHTKAGYLKAEEKQPGIRGYRYTKANAMKWQRRFYPATPIN